MVCGFWLLGYGFTLVFLRNGPSPDSSGRPRAPIWPRSTSVVLLCGLANSSSSSCDSLIQVSNSLTFRRARSSSSPSIQLALALTIKLSSSGVQDRARSSVRSHANVRSTSHGLTSDGTVTTNISLAWQPTLSWFTRPRRSLCWTKRASAFRILLTLSGHQPTT